LSYEVILSYNAGDQNILEDAPKALVGAIDQAVKAPAVTAKLAPLGIPQAYATPERQAAEMREEFRRVTEMVKKAGLTK
jgi:tripartite-type tricarboxylate transporter receptor subunit TctC